MSIAAQIKIMRQLMKDYPWLRKVFGSNLQGRHGAGQALEAQKLYGATPGVGEGMMGRAYALPTKATPQQPLPLEKIGKNIETLGRAAEQNPKLGFMIPQIGIGQAGYTPQQIAPLFNPIASQRNIALPSTYRELIQAPRTALGEFLAKSPILPPSGIKGINITTRSEDPLGRVLTNPNWGLNAKDKKRFFDVETPYKAGKSKAPTASQRMKEDRALMQSLIEKKFRQNPEIVEEINKRGGLKFLQASWHIPSRTRRVNPNSRWDGGVGESAFIQTLIKAYKKVTGPAVKIQTPTMKGTMYYRYGSLGRKGLKADTTFEAIKSGERTTTTRALGLGYEKLKKGDQIEFWSGKRVGAGEKVQVELTKDPWVGVIPDDPKFAQHWSKAEGWDPNYLANKGLIGKRRVIIRYKLVSSA